jgi:hypothetical protein
MAYTTIDDPSAFFQNMLWTGAGNSYPRSLTYTGNSDLKPDMLWSFGRSNTGSNWIMDSSRGYTANKELTPSSSGKEGDTNATNSGAYGWPGPGITNGHQISQAGNYWNVANNTYYTFGWKAADGSTTTFSENGNHPGGARQVNTTSGISIITYTGTGANANCNLPHGLGVAPKFLFFKERGTNGGSWAAWHEGIGDDVKLRLNSYEGLDADGAFMNSTLPDATNITVGGTSVHTNADARTYCCWAFAEVQGYSKFGKYYGNTNVDGTFVYTGFKPAMIIFKALANGNSWRVMNSGTSPTNPASASHVIQSNSEADVTGSAEFCDFLSNGFKLRCTGKSNAGTTFIYAAFAEQPFVTSSGVPATAK